MLETETDTSRFILYSRCVHWQKVPVFYIESKYRIAK